MSRAIVVAALLALVACSAEPPTEPAAPTDVQFKWEVAGEVISEIYMAAFDSPAGTGAFCRMIGPFSIEENVKKSTTRARGPGLVEIELFDGPTSIGVYTGEGRLQASSPDLRGLTENPIQIFPGQDITFRGWIDLEGTRENVLCRWQFNADNLGIDRDIKIGRTCFPSPTGGDGGTCSK